MRLMLIALQLLEGLEAAHKKGIVHRDMKPANVFVCRRVNDAGVEADFVKLLDFGISKMHQSGEASGLTMTGVAMGTPSYMSPEQFFDARNVDGRADLYSVAVMLYQLVTGKLPFEATSYADLIVKIRTETPPALNVVSASVPLLVSNAVMTGLSREKEHRWPSAREFANALRASAGFAPTGSAATPRPSMHRSEQSMMLGDTSPPSAPARSAPLAVLTPPAPQVPTPMPAAGWHAPIVAPPQTPAKKNGNLWLFIIIGLVVATGGCCMCSGIIANAQSAQQSGHSGR